MLALVEIRSLLHKLLYATLENFLEPNYTLDYWQKFLLKKDLVWRHYLESIITDKVHDLATTCTKDLLWKIVFEQFHVILSEQLCSL